jgi:hypothetical protein
MNLMTIDSASVNRVMNAYILKYIYVCSKTKISRLDAPMECLSKLSKFRVLSLVCSDIVLV